ncbi:hypothetical protein O181_023476 [Austropuccinia psidii MF-1]|uniref:PhoD-like phosphatase domain-containing protein n=1 Tax=Austropuccinia psidii MF-1 TaxID=1389203 RepID=A0A9Q3GXP3_9BASI|nr:hypothetical protein [Austropuccinia psidii MF-1]
MDEPGLRARYRAEKQDKYDRRHHIGGVQEPKPLSDECENSWDDPQSAGVSSTFEQLKLNHSIHSSPSQTSSITQLDNKSPLPSTNKRALEPHLQFMCGPMLRYDDVDLQNHFWLGFCCIVTADSGSVYNPTPILQLRWTTYSTVNHIKSWVPQSEEDIQHEVSAERIFQYPGPSDSYSFWRFRLVIPMYEKETRVNYSINHGASISFHIPAINQDFRWAAHSCNGFSAGVNREAFNGPDPVWNDLLEKHKALPFHIMVGGGDQLYCDPIAKEPELAGWLSEKDQKKKQNAQLTDPMKLALDRFFFSHYCNVFRSGAFGKAISCIPMINMLDDHDIIDGFGSYPSTLQLSPVFSAIGTRGYFWYLLFQLFIVDPTDHIDQQVSITTSNIHSSLILGGPGPYIPFRNHSFLCYLGPRVRLLLLDCRSERKKDQVCSPQTYQIIFEACRNLPLDVAHLVVQLGIPIVYPRMVFAERLLENRDHALFNLTRKLGIIPGFYNHFNADPELLDDMNDHWCAQSHKAERNWLLIEFQKLALFKRLRITFLSGDVHCAAVGRLFTQGGALQPEVDPKYMLNIISSAIVNTPPPAALIGIMGRLSQVNHKTLSHVQTDEDMMPVFKFDTTTKVLKNPRFMPRRNYCAVRYVSETGEMEFNIRVEVEQGKGNTKGYPVLVPPPKYQ